MAEGQSAVTAETWRSTLTSCLARTEPSHERATWLVPGLTLEESKTLEDAYPRAPRPAAVLIPIVNHADTLTVLLTTRATQLRNHAGQISFPGGSIEATETPFECAVREAREEIGLLPDFVSLVGYLPDHILMTGFRVTPVVAFVRPGFEIQPDASEVHDVFEAPLAQLLKISNYATTIRRIGPERVRSLEREVDLQTHSYDFEGRNIWGATAGILLNLARRCAPELQ